MLRNEDDSITATFSVKVEGGATTEQLGAIMTEQWPGTLVWNEIDPGYNFLIDEVSCESS